MADKITEIKRMDKPKEKIREENLREVMDELADNKDAILETIRFFKLLHEQGNLSMMNAMISYQETIMENVSYEANRGDNAVILKNLTRLLDLLGQLNLEGVDQLTNKLGRKRAVEDEEFPEVENIGFIKMMKTLKDPDVNRGLSILLLALKGVGSKSKDK